MEKTAVEKQVELDKEFPDSKLDCGVIWEFGDDWYSSSHLEMYFKFFSQSKSRHQFIIYSNKTSSTSNEFVDYKLDPFYLDKNHVLAFINGISEESIQSAKKEAEKQKAVDDMFK